MNELIWRRDNSKDIGNMLVAYSTDVRTIIMDRQWFHDLKPPNFITPAIIADIKAMLKERTYG